METEIQRKILVLFGSRSDKDVYKAILDELDKANVPHAFRICSAHRTPDMLTDILKEDSEHDYTSIIAGAGLAAHLPGVIASKTFKPIIGVPVHNNYSGLDAFLSIVQMPPGIPVMGVGVDRGMDAAKNAILMQKQFEFVNIIGDEGDELVNKAIRMLQRFEVTFKRSGSIDTDSVNIAFVSLGADISCSEGIVIYCPTSKDKDDAEYAINLLKHAKEGLWVGLNQADNAALSAIEIMNLDHRYDLMLEKFREDLAKKVVLADSDEAITKTYKKPE